MRYGQHWLDQCADTLTYKSPCLTVAQWQIFDNVYGNDAWWADADPVLAVLFVREMEHTDDLPQQENFNEQLYANGERLHPQP